VTDSFTFRLCSYSEIFCRSLWMATWCWLWLATGCSCSCCCSRLHCSYLDVHCVATRTWYFIVLYMYYSRANDVFLFSSHLVLFSWCV